MFAAARGPGGGAGRWLCVVWAALSPEGRVGCRGSSGAIELGLSCGAVELGRLALVICPSTCPLWAEESLDGSCTSFRVEQRRV